MTSRSARLPRMLRNAPTLLLLCVLAVYFLVPIVWLVIASTKSTADLNSTPGFEFAHFSFFHNLANLFRRDDGVYGRWLVNSAIYSGIGALGATLLAVMAGYALAKYEFPFREGIFRIVLAGVLVPGAVLALPVYLLLSNVGLVNSYAGVLLPALVTPFGVYLARIYAADAVPDEILEAARIDGSGEFRTFARISMPTLAPAMATIFLFQFVAIWNNFLLPLIVLSDERLYPVTLGLYSWQYQARSNPDVVSLVVAGSLVATLPLVVIFLFSQRFWRAGLAAGAIK
jgi:multiple sugar transport system permease protein